MIVSRNIHIDEWQVYKSLSLAALSDAPYAFTETVREAEKIADDAWRETTRRKAGANDEMCALALDHHHPVGMAAGLRDDIYPDIACLVGMWIDPRYRGTNAAPSVVTQVEKWVVSRGARILVAGVIKGNSRAAAFYQKMGFVPADDLRIIAMGIDGCEHIFAKRLKPKPFLQTG